MEDIIAKRRSVRFFRDAPIPEADLAEILAAGRWAPSPKNRQPWKFIVVKGHAKKEMLTAMAAGIDKAARGEGTLPGDKALIENARFTMKCMAKAPVTIFITNPTGRSLHAHWSAAEKIHELSDVQAIGAAAENMALEARARGIGSLWIGNIFFAEEELTRWLHAGQMVLALSLGYEDPTRKPYPLPRKRESDVVEVRG